MARSGATPVGTSILVDPARGRAGRPDPAALGHESVWLEGHDTYGDPATATCAGEPTGLRHGLLRPARGRHPGAVRHPFHLKPLPSAGIARLQR